MRQKEELEDSKIGLQQALNTQQSKYQDLHLQVTLPNRIINLSTWSSDKTMRSSVILLKN